MSSVFLYGGCLLMIAVPVIIAICAASFVPDEAKHREAIENDAIVCIKEGYSDQATTLGGEELGFQTSLFMDSSSIRSEAKKVFEEHNEIGVNESWFWSTGKLYNRNYPDGVTVSFGMFGVVIPFVTWDDLSIMDTDELENQSDALEE